MTDEQNNTPDNPDQTPQPPASEEPTPGAQPTQTPNNDAPSPVAPSPAAAATAPSSVRPSPHTSAGGWWWGTGRRKSAVARVRIRPGNGQFVVNNKTHDNYFSELRDHRDLMNVLEMTGTKDRVDVRVNVRGGGYTGQAGAIVLGLGRALKKYDETLEPILRQNGFLTRDPRQVERKKYGQPGARKQFQFSKR